MNKKDLKAEKIFTLAVQSQKKYNFKVDASYRVATL